MFNGILLVFSLQVVARNTVDTCTLLRAYFYMLHDYKLLTRSYYRKEVLPERPRLGNVHFHADTVGLNKLAMRTLAANATAFLIAL